MAAKGFEGTSSFESYLYNYYCNGGKQEEESGKYEEDASDNASREIVIPE